MKKTNLILTAWIVLSTGLMPVLAQQTTVKTDSDEANSSSGTETTNDADINTGLTVTEIRYKDRLDEVIVEHDNSGLREYYEFDNGREIIQEGSITERGQLRTWRFGGN